MARRPRKQTTKKVEPKQEETRPTKKNTNRKMVDNSRINTKRYG